MGVENLLTGKGDLDGAPGRHGELGGDKLVREDVALPAESSPVGGGDHADATHRQLEYLAQRAMHVVQAKRLVGDPLVSGGHGRDRIAHVPNFLAGERLLVLADREDTELYR